MWYGDDMKRTIKIWCFGMYSNPNRSGEESHENIYIKCGGVMKTQITGLCRCCKYDPWMVGESSEIVR